MRMRARRRYHVTDAAPRDRLSAMQWRWDRMRCGGRAGKGTWLLERIEIERPICEDMDTVTIGGLGCRLSNLSVSRDDTVTVL